MLHVTAVESEQRIAGTAPAILICCVCTNGRVAGLKACIRTLLEQKIDRQKYQLRICVVDNSLDDWTVQRVLDDATSQAQLLSVQEHRAGIPFARNAALNAALECGADFIAFIDDDEVAPPNWLAELCSIMQEVNCDVVQGGRIRSSLLKDAIEAASTISPKKGRSRVKWRATADTHNVLFRRWLLDEPFNLRFDEHLHIIGGSDTEFFMRAHDVGAKIARTKDAAVVEVWPPERTTPEYAAKRAFRVGACTNYRYRKNRTALMALPILLGRAAWRLASGSQLFLMGFADMLFWPSAETNKFRKASDAFHFSAGCVLPYFGIRPAKYY